MNSTCIAMHVQTDISIATPWEWHALNVQTNKMSD